jgi:acetyl esterase
VVPRATIPYCGMLQVSDPGRFRRRKDLPFWVDGVLHDVSGLYLRGHADADARALDMADPLLVFERGETPDRPLPPFFVPVGTRDPLLDDTRRLAAALEAMGVPCWAEYYEGEIHAFQAMVWRKPARRCWRDTFSFLGEHLGGRTDVDLPTDRRAIEALSR